MNLEPIPQELSRPLLLDLCCGAGGAAKGYHDAGFDVIGVDIAPQPNYPFKFIQADALEHLAEAIHLYCPFNYVDAIHVSAPCQAYTGLNNDKTKHPRLIEPFQELLDVIRDEIPWVIENVVGARNVLRDPVQLEGPMFGLHVQKRRLFETNWPLAEPEFCQKRTREFLVYEHGKWRWTQNVPVYGSGGRKAVEYWPYAMGVGSTWDDCWMTRAELQEAIPPAYTEYIGTQLLKHIHSRCEEQQNSEEVA